MFQMKKQNKTPEEELNEVEIGNISNKKFNVMIVKMFKELRRRLDENCEKLGVLNKELKYIKDNQKWRIK